jgi:hypothetical protein
MYVQTSNLVMLMGAKNPIKADGQNHNMSPAYANGLNMETSRSNNTFFIDTF